jgi:uncharacterized membrane protein HdeD (DUF308 family)
MVQGTQFTLSELRNIGMEELQKRWGWFLAMGILLVILGTTAIGSTFILTLVTMVFIGWLMMISGVLELFHAFTCKQWSGFFIDLFTGILYLVAGGMIVSKPGASALALTLLIAMFLIFGGVFRIIVALVVRYQNWGWLVLHGVINLLLGFSIVNQWPVSGMWVIGLFIGIDLLFNGWSLIMMGLAARNLPLGEANAPDNDKIATE